MLRHHEGGNAGLRPWETTATRAARIDIKAYDKWEFYAGKMIIPWKVEIPHEEVNFRTDSWDIDDSEKPKLDASFKLSTHEVLKLRKLAGMGLTSGAPPTTAKLYIAGTPTRSTTRSTTRSSRRTAPRPSRSTSARRG